MVRFEVRPQPDAGTAAELDTLAGELDRAVTASPADARALVEAAVARAAVAGAASIVLSAEPATPALEAAALGAGMRLVRDLLQLRCPLPVAEPWDLPVRPFAPGHDEEAWLEVNRRAFSWHPEQGQVTLDDLLALEHEPWFDPEGFLLHERDGRVAGFCWTKVHRDTDPVLGEIFVIGVDPDLHGQGLGRQLTLAGLSWLAGRGVGTGMLYVESDNEPARRLYEDLGFERHHSKRWYERSLGG